MDEENDFYLPTYIQGTFIPEISALIKPSTEPSAFGKLLRFQPEVAYSSSPDRRFLELRVGKPSILF